MSWKAVGLRGENRERAGSQRRLWLRSVSPLDSLMKPTPKTSSEVDRSRTSHRRLRHRTSDQGHLDPVAFDLFERDSSCGRDVLRDGEVVGRLGSIESIEEVEGAIDEGQHERGGGVGVDRWSKEKRESSVRKKALRRRLEPDKERSKRRKTHQHNPKASNIQPNLPSSRATSFSLPPNLVSLPRRSDSRT